MIGTTPCHTGTNGQPTIGKFDMQWEQAEQCEVSEPQQTSEPTTALWKAPSKLPPELPEAPALPPELIPAPLRPWLLDAAERMQVPLDFVAAPAVVALAGVIGRSVGIRPKRHDDWLVIPNLWGEVIGRPGIQKTPAVAEATRLLRRLAYQAQEQFEASNADAKAKAEILKLQLEAATQDARDAVKNCTGIEVAQDRISQVTK